MLSFWKNIYVREAFLMTLLLSVFVGFLVWFFLEILCFMSISYCTLLLFYVGSKINDRQRTLLTQALRFGDGASSSYCSNSGATDEWYVFASRANIRMCIGLYFHLATVINSVCNSNAGFTFFFMLNAVQLIFACLRSLLCRTCYSQYSPSLCLAWIP